VLSRPSIARTRNWRTRCEAVAPGPKSDAVDNLIEEVIVDAHGDAEQLQAFQQVLDDRLDLPTDAYVIGEPVLLLAIDFDGNTRRGLTARCVREDDGSEHTVAACDVRVPEGASAAPLLAAYRRWLGLDAEPSRDETAGRRRRPHKAHGNDIDLTRPVELVVLSIKDSAARCRLLGSDRELTLRSGELWEAAPGWIVEVIPRKHWRYARHPYLSGEIGSWRLDVEALGLVPLRIEDRGPWTPDEEYWGEAGEPLEDWVEAVIARGPRLAVEMEQVGLDEHDPDDDPVGDAVDLMGAGDRHEARRLLMSLCEADLRCLDAHAHLGNLVFEDDPGQAIRHYEVGVRIGELSLGADFDGLLPWGLVDNRPFLRCLKGLGLCLWRLGRHQDARAVFVRMLWLNPTDNQGARFLLGDLEAGRDWEDARG
jgi:hypothetical protein